MCLRLRAAILALAVSAAPSLAQEPSSLGLEKPFFVGTEGMPDRVLTIDLGRDGITDLLFIGSGLLYGTEPTPAGLGGALQVIACNSDGRWRHPQSFPCLSDRNLLSEFAKGDVDGDGFEDIVEGTRTQSDHPTRPRTLGIELLRQDASGALHRAGTAFIDSLDPEIEGIRVFGDGSGRVLVTSGNYDDEAGYSYWGTVVQWRAESGWRQLWSATVDSLFSYNPDRGGGILLGDGSPLWIVYARDYGRTGSRWGRATAIKPDGWGAWTSFDIPSHGRFHELERNGERQLWYWSEAETDSLYQILRAPGTDSVYARAVAIEGLPANTSLTPIDALVAPSGVTYFLAEGGRDAFLVALSPDGTARLETRWTGPDMSPLRLVMRPDGTAEVLWSHAQAFFLLPPQSRESFPALVPIRDPELDARADFDADGLTDLILRGTVGDIYAEWILRGIDRPPWFRTPEPVSAIGGGELEPTGSDVGDMNGDGRMDLLQFFRGESSDLWTTTVVCRFWDGWRFRPEGVSVKIPGRQISEHIGDFDGDRRDEVIVQAYDNSYEPRQFICSWNRDSALASFQELKDRDIGSANLWSFGDIDGDGRDELTTAAAFSFGLLRLDWAMDADSIEVTSLGSWINALGFNGGGVADLSGDGCDDLYWFSSYDSWIWSLEGRNPYSFKRREIPLKPIVGGFRSAMDVDTDGRADLVGNGTYGLIEMITDPLESARQSVMVLPEVLEGLHLRSSNAAVWTDVDRDGDPDIVVLCEDGIRVHHNKQLEPAGVGGAQPLIRFVGRHPSGGEARVAVHAQGAGEIVLELFDVTGRRIWREKRLARGEGWLDVLVQPRVGRAAVPAGVYFLRVEVSGRVETQRIVLGF